VIFIEHVRYILPMVHFQLLVILRYVCTQVVICAESVARYANNSSLLTSIARPEEKKTTITSFLNYYLQQNARSLINSMSSNKARSDLIWDCNQVDFLKQVSSELQQANCCKVSQQTYQDSMQCL
jgi:hypothetical protein